ncbi:MAG: T9SS type A sorting domain-containing protein [Bacteroidales bacterium]|nr:T9SS type A sorting domain-containing protein [Bacteroidales bacterium]
MKIPALIIACLAIPVILSAQSIQINEICSLSDTLNENSGLCIDADSNIWTLNDGGNSPVIYQINTSGHIVKKIYIKNASNNDWESLTTDRNGHFFIGDFGNNDNTRQNLRILKIPDPTLISGDSIDAEFINFSYEDQFSFPPAADSMNFDAEAFIHLQDHLYIFTKNRTSPFSGYTYIYKLPDTAGTYIAEKMDSLYLGNAMTELFQVTDATINYNEDEIMLCGYYYIWHLTGFSGTNFSSGTIVPYTSTAISQKEGLHFISNDSLIMCDEFFNNNGRKLYGVKILSSASIIENNNIDIAIYPNPANQSIHINSNSRILQTEIFTIHGNLVSSTHNDAIINISNLSSGNYIIKVYTETSTQSFVFTKN